MTYMAGTDGNGNSVSGDDVYVKLVTTSCMVVPVTIAYGGTNDYINGGIGNDKLTGGTGSDVYVVVLAISSPRTLIKVMIQSILTSTGH